MLLCAKWVAHASSEGAQLHQATPGFCRHTSYNSAPLANERSAFQPLTSHSLSAIPSYFSSSRAIRGVQHVTSCLHSMPDNRLHQSILHGQSTETNYQPLGVLLRPVAFPPRHALQRHNWASHQLVFARMHCLPDFFNLLWRTLGLEGPQARVGTRGRPPPLAKFIYIYIYII